MFSSPAILVLVRIVFFLNTEYSNECLIYNLTLQVNVIRTDKCVNSDKDSMIAWVGKAFKNSTS